VGRQSFIAARRALAALALVAGLAGLSTPPARANLPTAGLPDVCAALAGATERAEGIPPGLVQAVALAESGRWLEADRRSQAWPWTVTSGANSFFLASKDEALRKVRELRAAGRSNIDVGCMQINLGYHGDAFDSLEEALEPASNVAYGARFLKRLRLQTRSWARATARYHSSDPDRGRAYRDKVYRLWHELRHDRITDDAPVRLAGSLLGQAPDKEAAAPAQTPRLILPRTGGAPAPGAIAILRGR
jgi:Transglycosylase SLT domain